ncbi:MAG TPA: LamG domain-containing protein, partial [Candidatus Limnocylindrales bacterium]|nr:LamG domain-containing protein [Candidatus Limnocylindrales bacterium]
DAANRDWVRIPAIDLSGTRAVTIAFWAKRTYSTAGDDVLFEATRNYQNSTTGFVFLPDDDACHGVQAALRGNEGTTANCYTQPSSEVWHHLALVFDKSQTGGNEVVFYVDGVLQSPSWSLSASTNTNSFGVDPIYFFSRGGASQHSSGTVDDLRIYKHALTAAQIQQIYTTSGTQALWDSPATGRLCPGGTPGCVQASSASSWGSQTTSLTLTNNVASGDTLAVGIRWMSSTVTLSSLSVSGGCAVAGGFIQPTPANGSNPSRYVASTAAIAYGIITRGGHCTISSRLSATVPTQFLTVHELNVGAYDCSSINHQDSPGTGTNAVTSLTCATTKSGDYLLEEYFDMGSNGGTWTAGTGFVLETNSGAEGSQTEDMVQALAGSVAATFTTSVGWAHPTTSLMAFQPIASVHPNFTVSAAPASLSVAQGNQGSSTITTAISGGFNSAISLSAAGMPTGTTVSFNPQTIPAPGSGSSSMTIAVGSSTPTGTYPITVTGNGGGLQRSATVTLTVTAAPNFTISASPSSVSVAQGNQGSSTITTAISGGFNSAISLSAAGMPTGTSVSFSPQTIPAPGSGSSSMTIAVGSSTPTGTYPITVTGNGGGLQRSATVTLTVTAAPNFTILASPTSLIIMQGNLGTSTITTTVSGGFSSSISLSATGVPVGTTVSFNPNAIPAPGAGSSTMTITVGLSTLEGTYPITVIGTGGGIRQTVTVNLTVTAQVILTWTGSGSPGIAGYNAYRSMTSGGPYTKLNSSLISPTSYNDLTVQSGYTYYYVTTAVNNQGEESTYSNESSATVP